MKFISYENGERREVEFYGPDSAVSGNSYDEIVFTRQDMMRLLKMLDTNREGAVDLLQNLASRANYRIGRGIHPNDDKGNRVDWKAQRDQQLHDVKLREWQKEYQCAPVSSFAPHTMGFMHDGCTVCGATQEMIEDGLAQKCAPSLHAVRPAQATEVARPGCEFTVYEGTQGAKLVWNAESGDLTWAICPHATSPQQPLCDNCLAERARFKAIAQSRHDELRKSFATLGSLNAAAAAQPGNYVRPGQKPEAPKGRDLTAIDTNIERHLR